MAHTLAPFASATLADLVVEIRDRLGAPLGALGAELGSALASLDPAPSVDSLVDARLALARAALRDAQASLARVRALLDQVVAQFAPVARGITQGMDEYRPSVMAVDDEPKMLGFFRRALRDCDVLTFEDAREALKHIERGERFDVILSDLSMPLMNGEAFYAQVLRLAPTQAERFVFVTSGTNDEVTRQALAQSGRRILTKPFPLETLREAVQEGQAHRARAGE